MLAGTLTGGGTCGSTALRCSLQLVRDHHASSRCGLQAYGGDDACFANGTAHRINDSFNKRFGHQTGDAVLRQFADVLLSRMRSGDLVARYGGEEFVVILDGAHLDEATRVADEIRGLFATAAIDAPDGTSVSATVSAGCAAMGADLGTFSELVARADMALAIAKHAGRNQVVAA